MLSLSLLTLIHFNAPCTQLGGTPPLFFYSTTPSIDDVIRTCCQVSLAQPHEFLILSVMQNSELVLRINASCVLIILYNFLKFYIWRTGNKFVEIILFTV